MSQTEAIKYWIESAAEDWEVATKLMADKRYHHALFFVQLTIEKLIKAFHIKNNDDSPLYVHNLVLLAQKSGIELTQQQKEDLKEISSFNITARYDSYKRDFYNKATPEYAQKWFDKANEFRQLLLAQTK
jgi:HEPN domain-containing protein